MERLMIDADEREAKWRSSFKSQCDDNRVALEDVKKINAARNEINRLNLELIEVLWKGKPVRISDEKRQDWKFTGLNTMDFLMDVLTELQTKDD
jgi:hypothetical protein